MFSNRDFVHLNWPLRCGKKNSRAAYVSRTREWFTVPSMENSTKRSSHSSAVEGYHCRCSKYSMNTKELLR